MRKFELAKCCRNCDHRKFLIGTKVSCDIDEKLRWQYIKCSLYKKTTNERIISYMKKMIPDDGIFVQFMDEWLKINNLLRDVA